MPFQLPPHDPPLGRHVVGFLPRRQRRLLLRVPGRRVDVVAGIDGHLAAPPPSRILGSSAASSRSEIRTPITVRTASQRSEEHTSELQSLMRSSYAVFCLKKKKAQKQNT